MSAGGDIRAGTREVDLPLELTERIRAAVEAGIVAANPHFADCSCAGVVTIGVWTGGPGIPEGRFAVTVQASPEIDTVGFAPILRELADLYEKDAPA